MPLAVVSSMSDLVQVMAAQQMDRLVWFLFETSQRDSRFCTLFWTFDVLDIFEFCCKNINDFPKGQNLVEIQMSFVLFENSQT
jgi:hypothetical protein